MQREYTNHLLKALYWLFFIAAIGVVGYYYVSWKQVERINLPCADCDLRCGPCNIELGSGEKISLQIKPTNMPVLTSIMLEVKTYNIPVERMQIHFKGKEMNMGEFNYRLSPNKNGIYSVQTILPTCVHEEMVWDAELNIDSKNKHYKLPFYVVNERPQQPNKT